ncbi:hypothetical protein [Mycolicibacterium aubagnense]|uniref:Uncharacterized protein n=1 Tax=Mycolicibacterium aubagnense TaxID=319707 RepID=A0ABN5YQ21_9MYCO|nr:hypothetical protein [Mycolicibacterium aubagnense]TLH49005.1 hypothetical protein C1S80_29435 [Mycolicibacterium aubagnense]BBX82204.1 hypothetical protein MAUB_00770 [Mycolicibacterium aubagnense]
MSVADDFSTGSKVRILVHRSGVVPVNPGDVATVRSVGLNDLQQVSVSVTAVLASGTVHTEFAPEELERV